MKSENTPFGRSSIPVHDLESDESNRTRFFQSMFEMYTKLGITFSTDRPKAILGLKKRLSRTLNGTSSYGVLSRHLHRSLLWKRSGTDLNTIPYKLEGAIVVLDGV
jgi:hypothetical protein